MIEKFITDILGTTLAGYLFLILAVLVVAFVIREMFNLFKK